MKDLISLRKLSKDDAENLLDFADILKQNFNKGME
jgi:ornithine carbamoyltransferase